MRGYAALVLSPAGEAHASDALDAVMEHIGEMQGVRAISKPRWHWVLCRWPFASQEQLELLAALTLPSVSPPVLGALHAYPSPDRPASVGLEVLPGPDWNDLIDALRKGLEAEFWIEPNPPEAAVTLVKISPPSRKAGAKLPQVTQEGGPIADGFAPEIVLFQQTTDGFRAVSSVKLEGFGKAS